LQRILEGNYFNHLQFFSYQYRELYVEYAGSKSGYAILDFYIPDREIGSRKNTQFSEITIETGIQYLRELITKYPKGARIADVPSSGEQTGGMPSDKSLAGAKLAGKHVLEVPRQISPIPPAVLEEANRLGITIRDVYGHEYNKPAAPPPEAAAVPGFKDSNAPPPQVLSPVKKK
jgi:hypothetical protein